MKMQLNTVGVVRSPIQDPKEMPPLGVPASVELYPEYEQALFRLEKHSHYWILAWLDGAERNLLQVKPRGLRDQGPEALHGVFAVRSPARPNPIGLTVARLTALEGALLHFDRLDYADGTPVVDLKPYFHTRDCIFSATNRQIGRPASRQAMRESLLFQLINFCGQLTSGGALGVRLIEHYRATFWELNDPPYQRAEAPCACPELVGSILALTRLPLTSRAVSLHQDPFLVRIHCTPQSGRPAVSYALKPVEASPEQILGLPDEVLFEARDPLG